MFSSQSISLSEVLQPDEFVMTESSQKEGDFSRETEAAPLGLCCGLVWRL